MQTRAKAHNAMKRDHAANTMFPTDLLLNLIEKENIAARQSNAALGSLLAFGRQAKELKVGRIYLSTRFGTRRRRRGCSDWTPRLRSSKLSLSNFVRKSIGLPDKLYKMEKELLFLFSILVLGAS